MLKSKNTVSIIVAYTITVAIGLVFITFNIVGNKMNFFPGGLGDTRFNLYILEHGYKFFTGQITSYWNAPFMFPEKDVISYSDNLIGLVPFYAIFRFVGFDTLSSFQGWYMLLVVLNFTCCFLLLQWLFKCEYAAALGAFVFTFSIALQSQMTHAQTFGRFPIPLAIWMLLLFGDKFKLKYLFASFMLFVYQIYCGIYLGFLLLIPFTVILVLIFSKFRKELFLRFIKENSIISLIACFCIPLITLIPLLIPYINRSRIVSIPQYDEIANTIPVLKSYLFSQHGSLFWEFLSNIGFNLQAFWDHQLFTGGISLTCLFVMILVIKPWDFKTIYYKNKTNQSILLLSISAIITFICFIRFEKISVYWLLNVLPGFNSMRSMTRIINIELLFFSIAVAFVFKIIINKFSAPPILVFCIILPLLVADNFVKSDFTYHTSIVKAQDRVDLLINKMANIPKGKIISYEPANLVGDPIEYQIDAMLACQVLDLKCINGYTANSPLEFTPYWNNLNNQSRVSWLTFANYNQDSLYVIH